MKTLKFTAPLVECILRGEKTSTWRLFDDKDLEEGDLLTFVHKETGKVFGTAVITTLRTKTLGTLEDDDWGGTDASRLKKRCIKRIEATMATR